MAILKANDARVMDDSSLLGKLSQVETELLTERGQVKTGGRSSNPGRISELRRTRARIITLLHERALGLNKNVKPMSAAKKEEKKVEAKKAEEKNSLQSRVSSPETRNSKLETKTA